MVGKNLFLPLLQGDFTGKNAGFYGKIVLRRSKPFQKEAGLSFGKSRVPTSLFRLDEA